MPWHNTPRERGVPVDARDVHIPPHDLQGTLRVPPGASMAVAFAHGSGSSRFSPRNVTVAEALNRRGIATLLFDLLTDEEMRDRANVFDVPLLAERLVAAVHWLDASTCCGDLPLGLFGASTGAAAALVAATFLGPRIGAVVSRGGRPDLAADVLPRVTTPTLLIVGALDDVVLSLNRRALGRLACRKDLKIVPGATHLFEEPGAIATVIEHATRWFEFHLGAMCKASTAGKQD